MQIYVRLRYMEFQLRVTSLVKELSSLLIANHQFLANLINKTTLQTISNSALKTFSWARSMLWRQLCIRLCFSWTAFHWSPIVIQWWARIRVFTLGSNRGTTDIVKFQSPWGTSRLLVYWGSLYVNEQCFENHESNRIIFLSYYFRAVYKGLTR